MMEENNLDEFLKRKEEIEFTLSHLAELAASRNHVLSCFEKNAFQKTIDNVFSNLNKSVRKSSLGGIVLIKKNIELDLKLFRRTQFYLNKRRRYLLEELHEIEEKISQFQAGSEGPSPSIETPPNNEES